MGILDAPAASAAALATLQRRQLVPVATKAYPPADAALSPSASAIKGTAKLAHLATQTFYGARLVYVNWGSETNNTEQDGANAITVRASIEPVGSGMIPVTFNGNREIIISPGGTAISDPVGVDIAMGTTFWTRTYVDPGSGNFPLNNISTASSGEGNNYGAAGTDLTPFGSSSLTGIGTNQYVYAPAAIIGSPLVTGLPVIGILGDSIFNGIGDSAASQGGLAQRALANNYSFQKVAFPGESLSSGWTGSNGRNRARRVGLLAQVGCTHIITNYTVNDLVSATIQQNAADAWLSMYRITPGKVYATTLTPQTTTTDAWATVGNQTIQYPSDREPRRLAFNTWLRDGAPVNASNVVQATGASGAGIVRVGQSGHPLVGYVEVADLAESARDSGKWKAGYTSDGTHPNATGHAALAVAINPTTLFGPASS